MTGLYLSTRNGMAKPVTGEVVLLAPRLCAILFRQYAQDYADAWR